MKSKIDYLLPKAFLSNKGLYLSAIDSADSAEARKKNKYFFFFWFFPPPFFPTIGRSGPYNTQGNTPGLLRNPDL